jgi:hypothetical protein
MSTRSIALPQKAAAPVLSPAPSGVLQRKCACGQHTIGGECEECKKNKTLQRRSTGSSAPDLVPPIVHEVLRSPGQPLDAATRAFFEPRFGQDFSRVRVHTDAHAAESARAVAAFAYTVGRDIVFSNGQFNIRCFADRQLLTHELAHVVQQTGAIGVQPLRVGSSSDEFEREADLAASRSIHGEALGSPSRTGPVLQRQEQQRVPHTPGGGAGGPVVAPKGGAPPAGGGSSLCSAHPDELFYKTNPLFCMDTSSSGSMHAGFRCYREIPTGSGCPPGKHVCFDSSGKCDASQSHIDSVAPSIKRNALGMCDLSWFGLCTIEHGILDVIPALLAEGAEQQAKCIQNCQTMPLLAQGFCIQGCTGGAPF